MNDNLEHPADTLPLDFTPVSDHAAPEPVPAEPAAPAATEPAGGELPPAPAPAEPELAPAEPAAPAPEPAPAEPAPQPFRPASQIPSNRPEGTPPAVAAEDSSGLPDAWLDYGYGALLKALRERSGMSLKELEGHTMITSDYLRNIEEENLKKLPPAVYVIAYVRTLCRFYRVPAPQVEKIIQPLKGQVVHCVNDNMMQEMDIDDSVQRAEVRKIRKWALICGAVLLGTAVLAVILLLPRSGGAASADPAQEVRFNRGAIYKLLDPPALKLPEIPAAW